MRQLKPNVWAVLGGAGGNSTIIIGQTGVIVRDAKTNDAGARDLLAKITPKPVKTAIITHSDGDHVNGLVAFPAGLKIIAHENNKKEQEAALVDRRSHRDQPRRRQSEYSCREERLDRGLAHQRQGDACAERRHLGAAGGQGGGARAGGGGRGPPAPLTFVETADLELTKK